MPTDVCVNCPSLHRLLAAVISGVLRTGVIPPHWKETVVVHILKNGKSGEVVKDWRPISLLPCILKVCERVVVERLLFELRDLLPPAQHAYRQGMGVESCLGVLFLELESGGPDQWG